MARTDFRGFSYDALIHGSLTVPDEFRLTDFMNRSAVIRLESATFYALEDGRAMPRGDVDLALGEVSAVEPTDTGLTAWHTDLRVSTRSVQVEVDMWPYQITGFLHGNAMADPVEAVGHRRAMVPLTDAVTRFIFRGRPISRSSRVLIINRDRALRISRIGPESTALEQPALSAETLAVTSS